MRVVEFGHAPETIRQRADGLPWLPHRSNQELSQLFDVESSNKQDAQEIQLRIPGTKGAAIHVAFDNESGLPTRWQAKVDDKVDWSLEFLKPHQTHKTWQTVIFHEDILHEKTLPAHSMTAGAV